MSTAPDDTSRPATLPLAWGLGVLATLLRVLYVLALQDHPRFDAPHMDAGYHLAWAESLAQGEEFQDGAFFRAPLYPLFLASLLRFTGGSLLAVRLVQALLGGLATFLTVRLAGRVSGSRRAAGLAGALVAGSWILVAFDAELLIPTLLVPLVLLALERLVAWVERPTAFAALLCGLAFGLAAVARPNVLLFMPFAFGWMLWRVRSLRAPLALTLGTLLPIVPVTVHNVLEGDTTLIATQGGVNLWIGNNPASDGVTAIVPGTRDGWWEGYYDAISAAEAAEGRTLAATEVSAYYLGRTFAWWGEAPGAALALFARKTRLLVSAAELSNNQDVRFTAFRTLPALRGTPARWSVLFGWGVVGAVLALRRRRVAAVPLVGFLVLYGASIVLFFVTARFRVPLVPVLAVFSGVALDQVFERLRARDVRGFALVCAPAAALSILSVALAPERGGDANGLADLGRAEIERDRPLDGLRLLEEAHRTAPGNPQIAADFAAELSRLAGDHERALGILERVREGTAGTPFGQDVASIAIDVLIDAGRASEALARADVLLESGPADGRVRIARGRALAALGRGDEALATFRALARDEPANYGPHLMIGRLAFQMGRRDEARAAFRRVVELERVAPPVAVAEARAALGGG